MIRIEIILLAVPVFLSGCAVGPSVKRLTPAFDPAGVMMTIDAEGRQRFDAELLEVRDTAVLVRADRELILIPYHSIRKATAHESRARIRNHKPPSDADRSELRLLSRFPQGLSPELLEALLAAYGQSEVTMLDASDGLEPAG